MLFNDFSLLLVTIATIAFFDRRSLRYLRYFQQEEYNPKRFLNWIGDKKAFDTRGTLVVAIVAILTFLLKDLPIINLIITTIGAVGLITIAFSEEDPRIEGKLKLKMTERVTRIYNVSRILYIISAIALGGSLYWFNPPQSVTINWLAQIIFIQATPLWLILANGILWPAEKDRQQGFIQEAKDILADYQPFVIGITGSYGKTSTKAILGNILDSIDPTFWSPGSINTQLGITREIREKMKPQQEVAIIEMGAYHIGSIKRLCDFTPPQAAIVTAVGVMHLDRFGGAENIYIAKSELAQAVPDDGILVCNGDNLGARRMATEYPRKTTLLYGLDPEKGHLDCWMSDIQPSPEGTYFNIHWQGETYKGFTKLLGTPMLSNLVGAFTMCCALGKNPEYVIAAIYNLEPEKNRLNLRKNGDGFILDDSYNSNPIGFASALNVLGKIPSNRKILITPGMIELGEIQYEENRKIGQLAATICDIAVVVGDTNREALVTGLKEGGLPDDRLLQFPNRDEAFAKIMSKEYRQEGDLILIENDLPDLYETVAKF